MPVIRLNWIMANCTREHDSDVRDKGEVKAPGATPGVNSMITLKSTFSLVAVTEHWLFLCAKLFSSQRFATKNISTQIHKYLFIYTSENESKSLRYEASFMFQVS